MRIKEVESPIEGARAYYVDECVVIIENHTHLGWHISISHNNRYPTWDEIYDVKYHFLPDVRMVMHLPPRKEYVNVEENCFHLHEEVKP